MLSAVLALLLLVLDDFAGIGWLCVGARVLNITFCFETGSSRILYPGVLPTRQATYHHCGREVCFFMVGISDLSMGERCV